MKYLFLTVKVLLVVFVASMVWLAFHLYRPRDLLGFQLSPSTKVIAYNLGSRRGAQEQVSGIEAAKAIQQMNVWLSQNPSNWQRPLDDTIPQVQFVDGETTLNVWNNIIILYSPTLGSLVKEVDPKTNTGLADILKFLRQ